jgi:hypothetical protein
MSEHAASDDILVYLIGQEVNGSPERRLAAKFLLECLRKFRTRQQIAACIHELEDEAILDVGDETRRLAASVGSME